MPPTQFGRILLSVGLSRVGSRVYGLSRGLVLRARARALTAYFIYLCTRGISSQRVLHIFMSRDIHLPFAPAGTAIKVTTSRTNNEAPPIS